MGFNAGPPPPGYPTGNYHNPPHVPTQAPPPPCTNEVPQAAPGFTSHEFLSSMRHYTQQQQQQQQHQQQAHAQTDHKPDPNFCQQKYDLFKDTFEAAAQLNTNKATPSPPATASNINCTGYAGYDTAHSQHINASPTAATYPPQSTNFHQTSSYFNQTPPWKDFSEQNQSVLRPPL
ncbi:basic helix-loop-helix neural transcription factor TAP-like [Musca vetustissima]|uniref:basic helix-loop-helix neural transcription factor TAP-like n=1 Tax=Musca vetustissima TaxID=27455 RepID=UPI002AB6B144|nr:basic helix-loop-helix neural transcription factor TAP-like [Musca vetustissima]